MRAVIQRVRSASVSVEGQTIGAVGVGLCVLVGVERGDTDRDAERMARKLLELRLFEDEEGRMNRSLLEVGGAVLLVSQFTLLADVKKGRRPSFGLAEDPVPAQRLFEHLVQLTRGLGPQVETGKFRAEMLVQIENDGPVTLLFDTRGESTPSSP